MQIECYGSSGLWFVHYYCEKIFLTLNGECLCLTVQHWSPGSEYSFIHSALKGCSHSEPGPHLEWKGRGSWCSHTHPYHFQTLAAVRSMLTGISTAWFHTRGSTVTQQNTCTSLSIAVRSMATQITYWMQSRQRKWFMFSVQAKCMFIIHSFVLSRYTLSVDLKHRRSIYSSQITLMQQTCMPGQACIVRSSLLGLILRPFPRWPLILDLPWSILSPSLRTTLDIWKLFYEIISRCYPGAPTNCDSQ